MLWFDFLSLDVWILENYCCCSSQNEVLEVDFSPFGTTHTNYLGTAVKAKYWSIFAIGFQLAVTSAKIRMQCKDCDFNRLS